MSQQIKWKSIEVAVGCIEPTPTNYKIKSDLGRARLQHSLKSYGLAGNVVCNYGKHKGTYVLIDGNSRLEEAKANNEKKLWISVPSRALNPKEFKEMSALFDFAKAGEVDIERIQDDLGTAKDFYKNWGIEPPFESLGNAAPIDSLQLVEETNGKSGKIKLPDIVDIRMVQLFFSDKQEIEFRKLEEKLMQKHKTRNTTDTVLAVYKKAAK